MNRGAIRSLLLGTFVLVGGCSESNSGRDPVKEPTTHWLQTNPEPFASGCSTHEDCVLVNSIVPCGCDGEWCPDAAILKNQLAEWTADHEANVASCADEECVLKGDFDCDVSPAPACVASKCVYSDGYECHTAVDCGPYAEGAGFDWSNPDAVECVLTRAAGYHSFQCQECGGANAFYRAGGCADGFHCAGDVCMPLDPCTTGVECGASMFDGKQLACIDGFCRACTQNEECDPGQVCRVEWQGTERTPPGETLIGCTPTSLVAQECIDGTCEGLCRQGGEEQLWQCFTRGF